LNRIGLCKKSAATNDEKSLALAERQAIFAISRITGFKQNSNKKNKGKNLFLKKEEKW